MCYRIPEGRNGIFRECFHSLSITFPPQQTARHTFRHTELALRTDACTEPVWGGWEKGGAYSKTAGLCTHGGSTPRAPSASLQGSSQTVTGIPTARLLLPLSDVQLADRRSNCHLSGTAWRYHQDTRLHFPRRVTTQFSLPSSSQKSCLLACCPLLVNFLASIW